MIRGVVMLVALGFALRWVWREFTANVWPDEPDKGRYWC